MVRQNLNTFARHGAFLVPGAVEAVAEKLRNPALVGRAGVLPYQLLAAYKAAGSDVPAQVREALQDAMAALVNVPLLEGQVGCAPTCRAR
jgi:60 kDa SS-A/Ro ribonucleoprotein